MKTTDDFAADAGGRDPWLNRLSEYLDGELSGRDRRRLDEHLVTCGRCRSVLEELSRVVDEARGLATPLEPERDLWPGIDLRLDARPGAALVRDTSPLRWLAWRSPAGLALAASLAVVGVALVVWMDRARPAEPVSSPRLVAVSVEASRQDSDQRYEDAVAELRRAVRTRLANDPRSVEVIENNLATLDMAIAQYQDAILTSPGDPELTKKLESARQRKLTMLQQAVSLAAEATN